MLILRKLETLNKNFWIFFSLAFLVGIGVLDYSTGRELSFALFYLPPISILTWFVSRRSGIAISVVSAAIWFWAEKVSGHHYSSEAFYFWNSLIRFVFFLMTVFCVDAHKRLQIEKSQGQLDYLTGANNLRFFSQLAQREIYRAIRYRHPFSIAYLDIDDFKKINDELGHRTGDKVLRAVVTCLIQNLRRTDIVGRVGGDEFVIFLPEINDRAAQLVIDKVRKKLLDEMVHLGWNITFSFGLVSFLSLPYTPDDIPYTVNDLIDIADKAMYRVKRQGKDQICCLVYTD